MRDAGNYCKGLLDPRVILPKINGTILILQLQEGRELKQYATYPITSIRMKTKIFINYFLNKKEPTWIFDNSTFFYHSMEI